MEKKQQDLWIFPEANADFQAWLTRKRDGELSLIGVARFMAHRRKTSQIQTAQNSLQSTASGVSDNLKAIDEARLVAIAEALCAHNTETRASTINLLRKTFPDIPVSREIAAPPHFHLRSALD